jgi:hypothetical protein
VAKIADLTFETVKFANYAVNGVVTGSASIAVPNPAENPIYICAQALLTYSGTATGSQATMVVTVKRSRDNATVFAAAYGFSGNGTKTRHFAQAFFDPDATDEETYTLTMTGHSGGPEGGGSAGSVSASNALIKALYVKK